MNSVRSKLKYPIGTKIKFIGLQSMCGYKGPVVRDIGKIGKIVGYDKYGYPLIFLPESMHVSRFSTPQIHVTWQTTWDSIEVLSPKNQQLLFSFMR